MSKILVVITALSLALAANAFEYKFDKKTQAIVKRFITAVKNNDRITVAKLIQYPLGRPYPLPSINNEPEMIAKFSQVFDKQLIKEITDSSIKTDWSAVGWRGIVLNNGIIWFTYDGLVRAVNYQSPMEKKLKGAMIKKIKQQLHQSLRQFVLPVLVAETKQFKIRIDDLGKENYRYAAWSVNKTPSTKPDLILANGKIIYEGSGGNHHYEFKNGKYTYSIQITVLGTAESPAGWLEVIKTDKLILRQKIIKLI